MSSILEQIPLHEMEEILDSNHIYHAKPNQSDIAMHHLTVIWKLYVEPTFEPTCGKCLNRVLTNFKNIQEKMIEHVKLNKLI